MHVTGSNFTADKDWYLSGEGRGEPGGGGIIRQVLNSGDFSTIKEIFIQLTSILL